MITIEKKHLSLPARVSGQHQQERFSSEMHTFSSTEGKALLLFSEIITIVGKLLFPLLQSLGGKNLLSENQMVPRSIPYCLQILVNSSLCPKNARMLSLLLRPALISPSQ